MTDTPRTAAAQKKYDAIPQQSDGSEALDLLIDTLGDLRELERELAATKRLLAEALLDRAEAAESKLSAIERMGLEPKSK
jgi:hypothetical protein